MTGSLDHADGTETGVSTPPFTTVRSVTNLTTSSSETSTSSSISTTQTTTLNLVTNLTTTKTAPSTSSSKSTTEASTLTSVSYLTTAPSEASTLYSKSTTETTTIISITNHTTPPTEPLTSSKSTKETSTLISVTNLTTSPTEPLTSSKSTTETSTTQSTALSPSVLVTTSLQSTETLSSTEMFGNETLSTGSGSTSYPVSTSSPVSLPVSSDTLNATDSSTSMAPATTSEHSSSLSDDARTTAYFSTMVTGSSDVTSSVGSTDHSLAGSLQSSTSATTTSQTEVANLTSGDCSKVIGLSVTVAVIVWAVTVVLLLICLLKLRQKWKRKLRDERQRTDIWSLSTYHNTIINDNFLDYRLAPATRGQRVSDAGNATNAHLARVKQGRLSGGALSRTSSNFNDDYTFRQSIMRRSTMSDDERFRFAKNKSRAKRQSSNYSAGYWQDQGPSSDFRPRTSTFTIGKRDKRDRHVLVNHDELRMTGNYGFDGHDMIEKQPRELVVPPEQTYCVTEL